MTIGVLVAMDSEFNAIKDMIHVEHTNPLYNRTFVSGKLDNGTDIVCAVSGIGKVNATVTLMTMLNSYPVECVINTGCCGGINSNLKVGDIVVGTKYAYHDVWCSMGNQYGQMQGSPLYYESDSRLIDIATKISEENKMVSKIHFGEMLTGDRFVETAEECAEIHEKFENALTCDMESMAIVHAMRTRNHENCQLPFLSFRVVSDVPVTSINKEEHFKQYEDFWKHMSDISSNYTKMLLNRIERI